MLVAVTSVRQPREQPRDERADVLGRPVLVDRLLPGRFGGDRLLVGAARQGMAEEALGAGQASAVGGGRLPRNQAVQSW
ncbi:hypothetical protein [Streptomyces profundus]|uniref:hypothetical protein n=1 Tax=Streptomyces profundus TaxID=2867410 RepID=UPI001D1681CE|nr:hypothetical protein [Streptomyces sp. MA3_2.13]